MINKAVRSADILLPAANVDLAKWSVVAVDQHTSEPEYWRAAEEIVGGAPSTLRLVLPEIYLAETQARVPAMQQAMKDYLESETLVPAVKNGYILVERETSAGLRLGLMACVDLEAYDFTPGFSGPIRATEGTVLERVPPRVRLRRGAAVELPHVLMLLDDAKEQVIEPLYAAREALPLLYDFELMLGGGHIRGWKIEGEAARSAEAALDALWDGCGGFFLAVGDGNHSLAAARTHWLEQRESIPEAQRAGHPARFALVEIENLRSPAIQFEPIHRILLNVDPAAFICECRAALAEAGLKPGKEGSITLVTEGGEETLELDRYPLRELQNFIDIYMKEHPQAEIDYIHGEDVLRRLAARPDAVGIMPCAFPKAGFFAYVSEFGVLPRKAFSMGEADEKRFYCEARAITLG